MTWQRIDENTYIDDTLVTCAEYQLFIDEMREQGKYHQPDHWTSYQFPEGQAREPIVGVRYLDTVTFCEWLSRRENRHWEYRLPDQKELKDIEYVGNYGLNLGYWISKNRNRLSFKWIGHAPINIHNVEYFLMKKSQKIHHPGISTKSSGAKVFYSDQMRYLLSKAHNFDLTKAMKYANSAHPVDIDDINERFNALDLRHVQELEPKLHDWYPPISNYGQDFKKYVDFCAVRNLEINREEAFWRACYSSVDLASKIKRFDDRFNDQKVIFLISLILDLMVDLIILEERIAGRSPAFEGIRLVKERMQ